MTIEPGALVDGRYRVKERIGTGDLAEVWEATHTGTGASVALKVLLPEAAESRELVHRFRREAYLLGRIHSAHVARVLDFIDQPSEDGGPPRLVLVMDFIPGPSLYDLLAERAAFSVEDAIDFGADLADGLADLHEAGVIHRDIKPANVILQNRDAGWAAFIVDFAVGRLHDDAVDGDAITGITQAEMAIGTLEYMSPEQVLSARDVVPASDVYALGALLHRAVTGRHVFDEKKPGLIVHAKISREPPSIALGRDDPPARALAAIIERAVKRRPAERYPNGGEIAADLRRLRDLLHVTGSISREAAEVAWRVAAPFGEAPHGAPSIPAIAPYLDDAPTPALDEDTFDETSRHTEPTRRSVDAPTLRRPVSEAVQAAALEGGFSPEAATAEERAPRGSDEATGAAPVSATPSSEGNVAPSGVSSAPLSRSVEPAAADRAAAWARTAALVAAALVGGIVIGRVTAPGEDAPTREPASGAEDEGGRESPFSRDETDEPTTDRSGAPAGPSPAKPIGDEDKDDHPDDDQNDDDDRPDAGGEDGGTGGGDKPKLPPLVSPKPPPLFVAPVPPGIDPTQPPTPPPSSPPPASGLPPLPTVSPGGSYPPKPPAPDPYGVP